MKIFNKLFILSFILILSSCYTQFKTVTYSTPNLNVTTSTTVYTYPYYTSNVYYNYYNPVRSYSSFYYYNPYYRPIIVVDKSNDKNKPSKPKTTSYIPPKSTSVRTSGVNRTTTTTTVRSTVPTRTTTTTARKTETPQRSTTTTQRGGEVRRSEPTKSSSSGSGERTQSNPQRSNTNRGDVKKNDN